jgi:hypothetical protein
MPSQLKLILFAELCPLLVNCILNVIIVSNSVTVNVASLAAHIHCQSLNTSNYHMRFSATNMFFYIVSHGNSRLPHVGLSHFIH